MARPKIPDVNSDPHTFFEMKIRNKKRLKQKKGEDDKFLTFLWHLLSQNDIVKNNKGKWNLECQFHPSLQSIALGIAAIDKEKNCTALTTHDLHSSRCWDIEGLIKNL